MKRFIKEYANYRKQKASELINSGMSTERIEHFKTSIDRATKALERGLITVDETMRLIAEMEI